MKLKLLLSIGILFVLFFITAGFLGQHGLHAEPGGRFIPYLPENARWKYIVIHHSATEKGNAQIFDKGHRIRGFKYGLGYDFVINNGTYGTLPGQIEIGDRWNKQMVGAHCNAGGMNEAGIGICLVGNFDLDKVSPSQMDSAVWLVKHLQKKYGIPSDHILRHRDAKVNGTDCPGNDFPWDEFQKRLSSVPNE